MKRTLFSIMLFTFLSTISYASNGDYDYRQSEYSVAKTILLHEPGRELNHGMLHPQAALFEKYFNLEKSRKEHRNYVHELQQKGIKTLLVRDVLLSGCVNKEGETIESEQTKALRFFAFNVLRYDVSNLPKEKQGNQNDYMKECIAALSAEELVDIIIFQPTVILHEAKHNTGITASYQYNPLMNLFYTRDQSITTPKGVIIGKLNSPQRRNESEIIKFCYNKLGITPILEIQDEDAFLEGGDYLVSDNTSFIGCGMRTTQQAVNLMLENDVFGTDRVIVVKDKRFFQAEMHLDTYFNIIDKDLVTLGEERMNAKEGDKTYLAVDIYERDKAGRYKLTTNDENFVTVLSSMGIKIIPVNLDDQARLANNFLTVAPREIMAVDGQSDKFKSQLKYHGVKVTWLPLKNLTKGYGAAHCMTQVIFAK